MGLLAPAGFEKDSRRFLRNSGIRRPNVSQRSRASCFREICFSRATQNVVAQTTGSRRGAYVWFGFDNFCRDAAKCGCRSSDRARERTARPRTLDLRNVHAVGDDVVVPWEANGFSYRFGSSPLMIIRRCWRASLRAHIRGSILR